MFANLLPVYSKIPICIDTPVRSEFDIRLQHLQEKHAQDTPEFKLRVWAKMLVMYIQHSLSSSNF